MPFNKASNIDFDGGGLLITFDYLCTNYLALACYISALMVDRGREKKNTMMSNHKIIKNA